MELRIGDSATLLDGVAFDDLAAGDVSDSAEFVPSKGVAFLIFTLSFSTAPTAVSVDIEYSDGGNIWQRLVNLVGLNGETFACLAQPGYYRAKVVSFTGTTEEITITVAAQTEVPSSEGAGTFRVDSSTSGWPAGLFVSTTLTGAGGNFTALQGDAVLAAAKATVTGIECFMQLPAGGYVTGACRAVQGTIDFGNETKHSGGCYSAACFNIKGEGASCDPTAVQRIACLELKTEGTFKTGKDFEKAAQAYAIYFNGFTAASGVTNILTSTELAELSAVHAVGFRVGVGADGAAGAAYYVPMIPAADWN